MGCLDCGCGLPDVTHGNPDHITWDKLAAAAKATGITPQQAAKNIRKTVKKVGKAAEKADPRTAIADVGTVAE